MKSSCAIAAVVGGIVLSIASTPVGASVHRGGLASGLDAGGAGALILAVIGLVVVCALALAAIRAHRPTDELRKFGERLHEVQGALDELQQKTTAIDRNTRYLSQLTAPVVLAGLRALALSQA